MKYRLRKDVRSTLNPKHIYAKQGTVVDKVSDFGSVWIVEDSKRTRFSVSKYNLEEIK